MYAQQGEPSGNEDHLPRKRKCLQAIHLMKWPYPKYIRNAYNSTAKKKKKAKEFNLKMGKWGLPWLSSI